MARPGTAMLQFSIDQLRVLAEAWSKYRERPDANATFPNHPALAATVTEKLRAPAKAPRFFTRDEALLLAPAIGGCLDRKPRNIEGGMMLGQSEVPIIQMLLTLTGSERRATT